MCVTQLLAAERAEREREHIEITISQAAAETAAAEAAELRRVVTRLEGELSRAQLAPHERKCRGMPVAAVRAAPTGEERRWTPPKASAAPRPRATWSKQSPQVVARIVELGGARVPVGEIDQTLSREQFKTSAGTPWPQKNDGRVVVRTLLRQGIAPTIGGDERLEAYARVDLFHRRHRPEPLDAANGRRRLTLIRPAASTDGRFPRARRSMLQSFARSSSSLRQTSCQQQAAARAPNGHVFSQLSSTLKPTSRPHPQRGDTSRCWRCLMPNCEPVAPARKRPDLRHRAAAGRVFAESNLSYKLPKARRIMALNGEPGDR